MVEALATGAALLWGGRTVAADDASAAARMPQRAEWLRQGEAALQRLDVAAALRAFEQAAGMLHAADSELGLTRAYMQGGEYRRALSFAAHTAKAHRGAPGSAALYVWLLALGGYGEQAKAVLAEMQMQESPDPLLTPVRQRLQQRSFYVSGPLLQAPARLAPYAATLEPATRLRCIASGLLFDGGTRALVPAHVTTPQPLWLRDGLGRTSRASLERSSVPGLSVLRLRVRLPAPELTVASADAFPGSVIYGVEYTAAAQAEPAWPFLTGGFLGAPTEQTGARLLGLDLPQGPRGGPAFDASGRWIGVAVAAKRPPDRLLLASGLRAALGERFGPVAPPGAMPKMATEEIYERSLASTVQVLASTDSELKRG